MVGGSGGNDVLGHAHTGSCWVRGLVGLGPFVLAGKYYSFGERARLLFFQ
jgi:hypothetical protein